MLIIIQQDVPVRKNVLANIAAVLGPFSQSRKKNRASNWLNLVRIQNANLLVCRVVCHQHNTNTVGSFPGQMCSWTDSTLGLQYKLFLTFQRIASRELAASQIVTQGFCSCFSCYKPHLDIQVANWFVMVLWFPNARKVLNIKDCF